jgi:hypothetical protein
MSNHLFAAVRGGFANYQRLRNRGEFTDLLFTHESGNINAHRIIVCPQSKVFHKACLGGFKVSGSSPC